MSDHAKERERLEAEKAAIDRRREKRRQEAEHDAQRVHRIENALLRLRMLELVNVTDGVIVRHREPCGSRWAVLNDLAGTLVAVRRMRGTVDFGEHGNLDLSLGNLLAADEKQKQKRPFFLGGGR